ncbi:methyltransferase domain-containing protein [Microvirga tunisiensis]|uniref:Methyltransferase domain-containing protein n=2 Tax=Pannonibacter tanglangensis TaxID=2750084 RepID=A0ABW9ZBK9_9HYPH|nr:MULTISPECIES: methyltransferase domain-containing protein [unclassified Pannonibacter]NBN62209.1 methyltransferase domain-containing protein [Pannonibacter sp. XCT-34]NBN77877.1 methyltransferase domain-containing protein [Pannonibacter sp. XCT-53]
MAGKIGDRVSNTTACKVCGTHDSEIVGLKGRDGSPLTTVICTGCGLVHSWPLPSKAELDAYYASRYRSDYKATLTPKRKHILRYSRTGLGRLERIQKHVQTGAKVLDVGSGSGEFLYLAELAGYKAIGLEPHKGYSDYTRRVFGAQIVCSPLEEAGIEEGSFDAITLHHVLEHLHLPLTSLSIMNRWLKPGGMLFVDVPDIENTHHAPSTRFHYAHVYNFNHDTLKAMLAQAGFDLAEHNAGSGTSLVARKMRAPDPGQLHPMPENYARLSAALQPAQSEARYQAKRPLRRLVARLYRFSGEILQSTLVWHPRRIVDREYRKWKLAARAG